ATRLSIPYPLSLHDALPIYGLTASQLTFSRQAVWKMARNYTKEAGVRQLERDIGNVCRKAAKEILTTDRKKIAVTDRNIHRFLRSEEHTSELQSRFDLVCRL